MIDTLDITETVVTPAPPTDKVRYAAIYRLGETVFDVEMDIDPWLEMVTVKQQGDGLYKGFASMRPPPDLFEPAFAVWLGTFMNEARRRYEARGAAAS